MLHEGVILIIENYCKSKVVKPSPTMEKKQKVTVNEPHSKKIKVKSEEGTSDSKSTKKGNKQEIKNKNVEEVMDSKNSTEDDNKIEMGDLILNLEGYSGSKRMSIGKHQVEGSKDRKTKSNAGSEALGDEEEKQSVHLSPSKRKSSEEKMDMDTGNNNAGKVLVMKEHNLSKENKEDLNEK